MKPLVRRAPGAGIRFARGSPGFYGEAMKRLLAMIGEGSNGVEYVRFRQPFQHLEELGYELVTLGKRLTLETGPRGYRPAESLFDGIDGLIFPQMIRSPVMDDGSRLDLVGSVCEHATANGLPIIYSVDDYLHGIERHNPAFETINESIGNIPTILEHADAAFVTTPVLRETLAPSGLPTHLLPNAVDPQRWTARPRASRTPRIGWAGSSSHLEDLLMVLPAIRELQRRVDFRFLVFGLVERPLDVELEEAQKLLPGLHGSRRERAATFVELVRQLSEIGHTHVPFVDMDAYFEILPELDLDIGICPLLDNEFNRHKSALKFYEYAMCDTVTVASGVGAYLDEVSITVQNDTDDWIAALEALLHVPTERKRELTRQRRFVHEERNIRTIRLDWVEALEATLRPGRHVGRVAAGHSGEGSR